MSLSSEDCSFLLSNGTVKKFVICICLKYFVSQLLCVSVLLYLMINIETATKSNILNTAMEYKTCT